MTKSGIYKREEMLQLIKLFQAGKIGIYALPEDIIVEIYEKISKVTAKAFGETLTDQYNPFYNTTKKLTNNLKRFATYKMAQNMHDLNNAKALFSPNEFTNKALKINEQYMRNWLDTEYRTAAKQARGARKWSEVAADKRTFPFLQYNAVVDENSRDEHAALDGVIKPLDDGFWDIHMPPNGYNCRCSVDQLSQSQATRKGGSTDLRKYPMKNIDDNMNSLFQHNPGKTGEVFKSTHPYMDMRKRTLNKRQQAAAEKIIKRI